MSECQCKVPLWTFRKGQSECLGCKATADDHRGVPKDHYVVNGEVLSGHDVQEFYVCPICKYPISHRVVDGRMRLLCVGEDHDIAELGKARSKKRQAYDESVEATDAQEAWGNLPDEYKELINPPARRKYDQEISGLWPSEDD